MADCTPAQHQHQHQHQHHGSTLPVPQPQDTACAPAIDIADDSYFEGPEKSFEVWFRPLAGSDFGPSSGRGLRAIPREDLVALLDLVHCTILSSSHNDYMDAYVLSESSMFITPFRFILKTCGRTTLLWAVPKLFELARRVGLTEIDELFFSRRHFGKPELQLYPHTNFNDEVKYLDSLFDGAAYALGRVNSNDTWFLYTLNAEDRSLPCGDKTLEIIMGDLDPEAMKAFFKSSQITCAADVERASGIGNIFPNSTLDGFLFDPCGYSVNALVGTEHYFTIHVTPQDGFSYVSFETDVPLTDYTDLINKVTRIFRPGRFTITLFSDEKQIPFDAKSLKDVKLRDKMCYDLEHYVLSFYHFQRLSSACRKRSLIRSAIEDSSLAAAATAAAVALSTSSSPVPALSMVEPTAATAAAASAARCDGAESDGCDHSDTGSALGSKCNSSTNIAALLADAVAAAAAASSASDPTAMAGSGLAAADSDCELAGPCAALSVSSSHLVVPVPDSALCSSSGGNSTDSDSGSEAPCSSAALSSMGGVTVARLNF